MSQFIGPFLGFTYNGVHSSELGIVRTSKGESEMDLTPESKDRVIEIPGRDGQICYGTDFTKREFKIDFAFDHVTEEQLARMRRLWNDKKIHDLIFDETAYKAYAAKVSGSATIKHLCFEEDGQRIYKGEGTLQLVCNYPFARGLFHSQMEVDDFISSATRATIIQSSNGTSTIIGDEEELRKLGFNVDNAPGGEIGENSSVIFLYNFDALLKEVVRESRDEWINVLPETNILTNCGDLPMEFCAKVALNGPRDVSLTTEESSLIATLKPNKVSDGQGYAIIDTRKAQIIEYTSTGRAVGLLNHQITEGNFFALAQNESLQLDGIDDIEYWYIYY